jgi:flagellar biosynthesis protein FlhG
MDDQATGLRRAMRLAAEPRDLRKPPGREARRVAIAGSGGAPAVAARGPGRREHEPATRRARTLAITSGKGGVGKSNLAVNLAVAMSGLGARVCLLDADLGLANADVLCNLTPRLTLEHVVAGRCRLAEAAQAAPGGFRLVAGASGVERLADLDRAQREALLRQLDQLEAVADVILVDTGAGLGANVLAFASAADAVLVVTTPEPTALTDGYAMIKSLSARDPGLPLHVVVNSTRAPEEGEHVFGRLDRVARAFLGRSLSHAGAIPADPAVSAAVRARLPLVLHAPDSPAAQAVQRLARWLLGVQDARRRPEGFFARLAGWLGVGGADCANPADCPGERRLAAAPGLLEIRPGRLQSAVAGVDSR